VRAARFDVFIAGYSADDAPLFAALAALPRPGVHLTWIAPHVDAARPALERMDVWTPPASAVPRSPCLIVDTARFLLGELRSGPAVLIADAALARALTAEWRTHLLDAEYRLSAGT
jgi:hypothetical protein